MNKQFLIGIDIGTSACKSLLVDEEGKVIDRASEGYPLSTPHPGWSEQDPEDWWRAVKTTLKKLTAGFHALQEIKAIGLSGQMHGLVPLDKDDRILRLCILWNDQRTERQCQEIYERVGGLKTLLQLTNNRMLPGYTAGKILWMRDNEPRLYEKIRVILNPKDYIRFRLTGEYATEVSDASGTGFFNVKERNWSLRLLEILNIPKDWLPQCYESFRVSGKLLAKVADELGLPAGLPVVGGGGDAVVQTTGMGIINPEILGITIGTAGNVSMALNQYYDNPEGRLQFFCNNIPNRWHMMGVTLAAGGSLRWFRDTLGETEKEVSKRTGKNVYDLLSQKASKVEPGSEGLLFLPFLIGERCPYSNPNARGAFIGLTLRHTRFHLLRSIMEGVIFSLRDVTGLIQEMGIPFSQIRTSGGGALSNLWRQILADVFNNEVSTTRFSGEGGAYGAALVAGVGVGLWPSIDMAVGSLTVDTTNLPNPKNAEIYDKLFKIYQGLYRSLKNDFDQLSEINPIQ